MLLVDKKFGRVSRVAALVVIFMLGGHSAGAEESGVWRAFNDSGVSLLAGAPGAGR